MVTASVAVRATVAVSVKVARPATARLTVVEMAPDPFTTAQLEPTVAPHCQLANATAKGISSRTSAFDTALGPPLVTIMV